jgi:hypothetical protein
VLSNVGLKMNINYCLAEDERLLISGGLRKTTNHCLTEVVSCKWRFNFDSALELELVNVNHLVAIQHSGTALVWCNPNYER